jgi:hypothetical protein
VGGTVVRSRELFGSERRQKEMQPGETVNLEGYAFAAYLDVLDGGGPPYRQGVRVVHNHSTHYLLFWVMSEEAPVGEFIRSFQYWDEDPNGVAEHAVADAYTAALMWAVRLVLVN